MIEPKQTPPGLADRVIGARSTIALSRALPDLTQQATSGRPSLPSADRADLGVVERATTDVAGTLALNRQRLRGFVVQMALALLRLRVTRSTYNP